MSLGGCIPAGMVHARDPRRLPDGEIQVRLLLLDAGRLMQRYHTRDGMDLAQRRRWAADVVKLLAKLQYDVPAYLMEPLDRLESGDITRTWVQQFRENRRIPKPMPGER